MNLSLPVSILREGNRYVAYSPALDLSTSGRTHAEAQRRFAEAAMLFFEEINRKRTMDTALTELGWQRARRTWQAPVVVSQSLETFSVPA